MRKNLIFLFVAVFVLTSATIAPKVKPVDPDRLAKVTLALDNAKSDGKITKKELIAVAEVAKGEKLTLKERISLKIFGKKIGNKIMEADANAVGGGSKSQLIAALLCFFLGGLGIHRFYLGYTWQGIVQLLTAGGCGIWALIDFIRILTGDLTPKNGDYDKTL